MMYIGLLAISMLSCRTDAPETPRAGSFRWKIYTSQGGGYTLIYPDIYTYEELYDGDTVHFFYGDRVVIMVHYTTTQAPNNDGLWFGESPVKSIQLGNQNGQLYDHIHTDGVFGTRTLSYVITHNNHYLALEFKTDNETLNSVQEKTLLSFDLLY